MRGRRQLAIRAVSLVALFGGAFYLTWRAGQLGDLGWLAAAFFAVEVANYLALVVAVALFWSPYEREDPGPPPEGATMDLVIPVCGEDADMVEATLLAALAVEYPHRTIVLNDGRIAERENWREIEDLCRRLGVTCLTRRTGSRGKAGNLNAALPHLTGEFIVALDCDHLARPELGHMLLGFFNDPKVGFVTSHQCFQLESGDLLGHQEALFYRAIQPAKDRDNAAFSCGNGAAYRRAAIESVGGYSEWNLVEDLHTSMQLHARGWRSAYQRTPVSVGTAPSTAAEMAAQRLRWATDSLRILFWDNPIKKAGLSLKQRLHYLHTAGWYLIAAAHIVFLASPVISIAAGVRLLVPGTEWTYAGLLAIYLAPVAVLLMAHVGWRAALRTAQMQAFLSPVFALAVPRALKAHPRRRANTKKMAGGVTRKTKQRSTSYITWMQHAILASLIVAIGMAIAEPGETPWAVVMWACLLAMALATPGSMLGFNREAVQSLRIAITAPAVGAALLVALSTASVGQVDARTAEKQALGNAVATQNAGPKLQAPSRGMYLGAYNSTVAGPPSKPVTLNRYPGAKLRIIHRFQAWWSDDRLLGPAWLKAVADKGAVPMVSWEPWDSPAGGRTEDNHQQGIVKKIARGRFDVYIRKWARDAAAYKKPILIRFMHEMNGSWYPWSARARGNTPAAFKAAWRRTWNIFRSEGATNVSWVFSVDSFAGGKPSSRGELNRFYPGGKYVDWIGLSGFNWVKRNYGGKLGFERVFRPTYNVVKSFGKPVMLSEVGSAAIPDAGSPAFVRNTLRTARTKFPAVRAVVWYDARHPQRDFTLRGAALSQFRAASRLPQLQPGLRVGR